MFELKTEVDLISYLANPYVRGVVKNTAKSWRFTSLLAQYLQEYYLGLSNSYIPSDIELESFLSCKTCEVGDVALAVMRKTAYANVSVDGAKTLINSFFYHYRKITVSTALSLYNEACNTDAESAMSELIRTVASVSKVGSVGYEVVNYADTDIETYMEEEMCKPESIVKSKFNLINDSTPLNGYQKGWLVQIAAPPSAGKTQLMLNEAVYMAEHGHNIVWIALGDMHKKSMLRRILCLVNHVNKMDLGLNVKRYWNAKVKEVTSRIRFVFKPAYEVASSSIINIVNSIETPEFPVDVVIVDYDGNLKHSDAMMYERGNVDYGELKNVATDGLGTPNEKFKLVFVGSQVKEKLWGHEELGEDCCAESSGKPAKLDLMITLNCNPGNHTIGCMNIAKNRDGVNKKAKYHLENWGCIRGISVEEYNVLLNSNPHHDNRLIMNTDSSEEAGS
jgi:hypothetical protein